MVNENQKQPYSEMAAEVYDALYSYKDYAQEADYLKGVIAANKQSDGDALLDFACGTGGHLAYLMDNFEVEGVDLSSGQIEIARKRIPEIPFHQADMRTFKTDERFDVVTCLFSSIAYLHPLPEMEKGIANMSRHLKPGGVLVVEPWLKTETYTPGHVSKISGEGDGFLVTRIGKSNIEGNLSVMSMEHTVERPESVKSFTEVHELAMYTDGEYRNAFERAGLSFDHDDDGLFARGLYIGVKPVS